jgi:putative RecB family exonuclease
MRKPVLSPTRLTTYLACPVKYRWTFIDPRGKVFQRAKWYYSFGTSLHRTLEELYKSDRSGVPVVAEAIERLEENWVSAGYASPDEAEEALAEGRTILTSFVEAELRRAKEVEVLDVERRIQLDMGHYILLGVLDRINKLDNDTIEVVDYKSLRHDTTEEDVRNDLAMNVYQLLVRSVFPAKRYLSTIIALRTGEATSVEVTDVELAEFRAALDQLASDILNQEFDELVPRPKAICRDCDFLRLCRKHPDFEEAFGALGADLGLLGPRPEGGNPT